MINELYTIIFDESEHKAIICIYKIFHVLENKGENFNYIFKNIVWKPNAYALQTYLRGIFNEIQLISIDLATKFCSQSFIHRSVSIIKKTY